MLIVYNHIRKFCLHLLINAFERQEAKLVKRLDVYNTRIYLVLNNTMLVILKFNKCETYKQKITNLLTIERYVLISSYFCTYISHLLNFLIQITWYYLIPIFFPYNSVHNNFYNQSPLDNELKHSRIIGPFDLLETDMVCWIWAIRLGNW